MRLKLSDEEMQRIKEEEEVFLSDLTNTELEQEYFRCLLRKSGLEHLLKIGSRYDDFAAMAAILMMEKAYNSGIQVTPFRDSVYGKYAMSIVHAVLHEYAQLPHEAQTGLGYGSGAGLATYFSGVMNDIIEKSLILMDIKKDKASGLPDEEIMIRNHIKTKEDLQGFLSSTDTPELEELIERMNGTGMALEIKKDES